MCDTQELFGQNQDYSKLTLRPKNEIEDKLFYKFRIDDCMEMLKLFYLGLIVLTLFNLATFILTGEYENLISATETFTISITSLVMILLYRRLKEKIGNLIYVKRVLITIVKLVAAYVHLKMNQNENDPIKAASILKNSCFLFRQAMILYAFFISPRFSFVLFNFFCHTIGIISLSHIIGEFEGYSRS